MNTYISKKIINFARSFPDLGIQSKPRPEEWKTPDSTCRTKSSSMTNNNRILFISQEIAPYIPSGEAAQLGRSLPQDMQERGYEVRTFMPRFGTVNERRNPLHEVIRLSGMNIIIDDNDHPLIIKVASMQPSRIQVYFIDNDDYFQKLDSDIDPSGSNRADNDERAIFYARGTIETARKLRWDPKVIFVSGWMSALNPLYIRKMFGDDPSFKNAKIIYMVTPEKVGGPVDERIIAKLKAEGFSTRDLKKYDSIEHDTDLLHRMAIDYSNAVIFKDPEASQALIDHVKESGKPFMTADQITGPDSYSDFIKSL